MFKFTNCNNLLFRVRNPDVKVIGDFQYKKNITKKDGGFTTLEIDIIRVFTY